MPAFAEQGVPARRIAFFWHCGGVVLGGAQTLLARMANNLSRRGHDATVVILGVELPAAQRGLFDAGVRMLHIGEGTRAGIGYPLSVAWQADEALARADILVPFNEEAALHAWALSQVFGIPMLPYVIGTNCYQRLRGGYPFRIHPAGPAVDALEPSSIVFFSEDLRRAHGLAVGKDMGRAHVLPLPVDTERFAKVVRRPVRGEVLSVGRIDPDLKPYNYACLGVIKALRDEGLPVHWTVYGGSADHPVRAAYVREIQSMGLADCVTYGGEVGYADLPAVFAEAFVFIGMGTAAVEAAAAGVPAIVAIAHERRPVTQGMLYELPGGSIGERVASMPERPIEDLLRHLLTMPDEQYAHECERSAAYARQAFGIDPRVDDFLEIVEQRLASHPSPRRAGALRLALMLPRYAYYRIFRLLDTTLERLRRRS